MKKERPIELWIVIIIAVLYGIMQIIISRYILLHEEIFLDYQSEMLMDYQIYAYIGIIIGIIHLIVAYGLFRAMKWAWYVAVLGCVLYLINGIVFSLVYPINYYAFSIFLNIGCLYLLFRLKVKEYFGIKKKKSNFYFKDRKDIEDF